MKKSDKNNNDVGNNTSEKVKKSKWGINDITAVLLFVLVAFGIAMQF